MFGTPVPLPVEGPLTDAELRAAPVPTTATVSGTVTANAGTGPWPVTDNGGSLTVDGPLTDTELRATAVPVSAASLPLPTGAATAALQTQPGVDIGDVTVNNLGGGSAVNVQDGGNSLTVDGTVAATQSGNWSVRLQDGSGNAIGSTGGALNVAAQVTADARQQFSQFGELLTAQRSPQAAWRFNYGIIDKLVTKTETNGGTVTVANDKAILQTSTNTAGLARVETIKRVRYLNGFGGFWLGTAVWTAGKADSRQIMGLGDTVDRIFIGYWGTDFVVGRRRAGVDDAALRTVVVPTWNTLYGNIFGINFGWLGYQGITFTWYNPTTRVITPIAHLDYANTSPDVYILNPTLQIFAEVANTGNNTNLTMETPSAIAGTQGYPGDEVHSPLNVYRPFDVSATYADTNNNKILSIRNKSTAFAGAVNNRVPVAIRSIDLSRSSSGAATSTVRVYKSVTTSADPLTFTDVDTNNSPVATNVVAATITTGSSEYSYTVSSADTGRSIQFDNGQLVLYPGDTLTIAIQASGNQSTTYTVTVNWEEQF